MKYKYFSFVLVLATVSAIISSCRTISEKDVIGAYASDNPERDGQPSKDTLVIQDHHRYFYKNYFGQFHGTWGLQGAVIDFHNDGKTGMWPAKAEFHKDTIRIVYAAEEGIYYTKIKNQGQIKVPLEIGPARN